MGRAARAAVPMILHGNPTLFSVIGFTLQVAVVATLVATIIGVPIGLAIGLGRFRGRQVLRVLANASLALPPVLVGAFLFVLFLPQAPLGSLQLISTKRDQGRAGRAQATQQVEVPDVVPFMRPAARPPAR